MTASRQCRTVTALTLQLSHLNNATNFSHPQTQKLSGWHKLQTNVVKIACLSVQKITLQSVQPKLTVLLLGTVFA
jgi:hypothetical protein